MKRIEIIWCVLLAMTVVLGGLSGCVIFQNDSDDSIQTQVSDVVSFTGSGDLMDEIKEMYLTNKSSFSIIAEAFSNKYAELNDGNYYTQVSGRYYVSSSQLSVTEYMTYQDFTYNADSPYFDFSDEQLKALYSVLCEFNSMEFWLYDGQYNLLFEKSVMVTSHSAEGVHEMYGLAYSFPDVPDEYYSIVPINEEPHWYYAHHGFV